jgi:hypothetical protein
VNDSFRGGASVIHQTNNQNYHKAATQMSRQQTINDVESKHETDILFISCQPALQPDCPLPNMERSKFHSTVANITMLKYST